VVSEWNERMKTMLRLTATIIKSIPKSPRQRVCHRTGLPVEVSSQYAVIQKPWTSIHICVCVCVCVCEVFCASVLLKYFVRVL
jgi:hypothetical protein